MGGRAADLLGKYRCKVDIRDEEAVITALKEFKPDLLVHCAAERRPDVAEKDPDGTKLLNVVVSRTLAELSGKLNYRLIYICTDYVFDGNAPPDGYDVDAIPNPTNLYGQTKLAGEQAILQVGQKGNVVSLRVPVLYGAAQKNDESAVNILLDGVNKAAREGKVKMDNWATRFPTLVDDVAKVIRQLAEAHQPYPPILHFSSPKQYTKYTIALVFAQVLGLSPDSITNLIPLNDPPQPGETIRPRDCKLSNKRIEALGIDTKTADFENWWTEYLKNGNGIKN